MVFDVFGFLMAFFFTICVMVICFVCQIQNVLAWKIDFLLVVTFWFSLVLISCLDFYMKCCLLRCNIICNFSHWECVWQVVFSLGDCSMVISKRGYWRVCLVFLGIPPSLFYCRRVLVSMIFIGPNCTVKVLYSSLCKCACWRIYLCHLSLLLSVLFKCSATCRVRIPTVREKSRGILCLVRKIWEFIIYQWKVR